MNKDDTRAVYPRSKIINSSRHLSILSVIIVAGQQSTYRGV